MRRHGFRPLLKTRWLTVEKRCRGDSQRVDILMICIYCPLDINPHVLVLDRVASAPHARTNLHPMHAIRLVVCCVVRGARGAPDCGGWIEKCERKDAWGGEEGGEVWRGEQQTRFLIRCTKPPQPVPITLGRLCRSFRGPLHNPLPGVVGTSRGTDHAVKDPSTSSAS